MSWTGDVAEAGLALLLIDTAMTIYTLRAASRLVGAQAGSNLMLAVNPFPVIKTCHGQITCPLRVHPRLQLVGNINLEMARYLKTRVCLGMWNF